MPTAPPAARRLPGVPTSWVEGRFDAVPALVLAAEDVSPDVPRNAGWVVATEIVAAPPAGLRINHTSASKTPTNEVGEPPSAATYAPFGLAGTSEKPKPVRRKLITSQEGTRWTIHLTVTPG